MKNMTIAETEILENAMDLVDKMKRNGYTLMDKYSSEAYDAGVAGSEEEVKEHRRELMEYIEKAREEGIITEDEKRTLYLYYAGKTDF